MSTNRTFSAIAILFLTFCAATASAREHRLPAGDQDPASYKSMTCTTDSGKKYTGECHADGKEVVCIVDAPEDVQTMCLMNRK